MTSHDAVFKLRKILHEKKIGHSGTLDPDVTGVLPIAVGKATRVIEYMTEAGKVYEGEITIGFSTTTEDASGEVVQTTPITELDGATVDQAMASFEEKSHKFLLCIQRLRSTERNFMSTPELEKKLNVLNVR